MKNPELLNLSLAVLTLAIVIGFQEVAAFRPEGLILALVFALVIISVNVGAKKLMASRLDAGVEHEIWGWSRYGLRPAWHFKKEIPVGVIIPLFVTAFSLGVVKVMTLLTYEATALKRRAAKKFGHYSYTEMTDWHNGVIGAAGIIAVLLLSFVSYWFAELEPLARFAAFYAFFNMLPISKLDGTQIFFGSRVLWFTLAAITLIFAAYAII
jgi:hypothetical protein